MKKLLITVFAAIALMTGCSQSERRYHAGSGWSALDDEIDSMIVRIDSCYDEAGDQDSIRAAIKRLGTSLMRLNGKKRREGEARLRLLKATGDNLEGHRELAIARLDTTLSLCDSANYPYTFIRAQLLRNLIADPSSPETFRMMLSALDYYKAAGDMNQEALVALCLSQSLNNPEEPGLTLYYFRMADSIYEQLGKNVYHTKNRINEAYLLYQLGEKEQSRRIYDELLLNPIINDDEIALEIVLRNMAVFFDDSTAMRRGYLKVNPEESADKECRHSVRALYEALLCEHFMKTGERDSAAHYASMTEKHFNELIVPRYRSLAAQKLSDYYDSAGKTGKTLEWMKIYKATTDSIVSSQGPWKKIYLDNVNTLHRYEHEAENIRRQLKQRHYRIIYMLISGLLMLTGLFLWLRTRQKLRNMKMRYEWERSQRKLMAMSLSRNEADKVIDYVRNETSRLSRESTVAGSELSQIERNLRIHQAGRLENDAFEEVFGRIHPDFVKRLKEISPTISENNIRLCSYIVIGLSNQQIAEMLNVQASSIKQSRWRLRNRLKIPASETLEDFLRSLSE